jgi:cytochrome c553
MRMWGTLIGMLFVSAAIHAESLPAAAATAPVAEAASGVVPASAAAPAAPEQAGALAAESAVAPAAPEVAAAPPPAPGSLEERLQLCGGCHNPDGNSIIPENPRLAGLDAKYIARQLADFKEGKRENPIMSSIIPMVDEKEFKPLAIYFSKQKRMTSESDKADLLAKGKQIFEEGVVGTGAPACGGCHGEDGSGSAQFPRLNGQNPAYVVNQLMNFKTATRTNDPKAVMQTVAKRLNEAEINAIAEYVSTLKEAE